MVHFFQLVSPSLSLIKVILLAVRSNLEFSNMLQLRVHCPVKKKVTVKDESTGESKEEEVDVFDNPTKMFSIVGLFRKRRFGSSEI